MNAIQEMYMSDIFLVKSHLIWRKKNKAQYCQHYLFRSKVILHSMKFEIKNNSLTFYHLSKDIFVVEKGRKEEQKSEQSLYWRRTVAAEAA